MIRCRVLRTFRSEPPMLQNNCQGTTTAFASAILFTGLWSKGFQYLSKAIYSKSDREKSCHYLLCGSCFCFRHPLYTFSHSRISSRLNTIQNRVDGAAGVCLVPLTLFSFPWKCLTINTVTRCFRGRIIGNWPSIVRWNSLYFNRPSNLIWPSSSNRDVKTKSLLFLGSPKLFGVSQGQMFYGHGFLLGTFNCLNFCIFDFISKSLPFAMNVCPS